MAIEKYNFKSFGEEESEQKIEEIIKDPEIEVIADIEIEESKTEETAIIEPEIIPEATIIEDKKIDDQDILNILELINALIEKSAKENQKILGDMIKDASQLAMAIAKKIALKALGENPLTEIEVFLENSFKFFQNEQNIEITLNPKMLESVTTKIEELKPEFISKNSVVFKPDADHNIYDCDILWNGGKISLNKTEIIKRIENLF